MSKLHKVTKVGKVRKVKSQKVNVMEDDEFPIEEIQHKVEDNVSMKKIMEDVVKTEADSKGPILSSFPKALEKVEKKEKKTKKISKHN
jgi:hypothetical protein